MEILLNENIKTLNDLGIRIYQQYPNVRFLFEIDFSKDDYLHIKQLFQKDYQLKDTYFQNDFFTRYFRNNQNHRIPFLILLVGFIRYEYLNNDNRTNFFDNFLKNILQNNNVHEPESFGQLADLHSDTQPEFIRTASRFTFGQFCKFPAGIYK